MTTNTAKIEELFDTLPLNLNTATPREIDTVLAALSELEARAEQRIYSDMNSVQRAIGQRKTWIGRREVYPMPFPEALAIAQATIAAPGYVPAPKFSPRDITGALASLEGHRAELAEVLAAAKPLEAQYAERRWSRFFWVQNNGGHVHSSMQCSTCNKGGHATAFGWNPDLSGLDEAAAVAKLGPMLCTVCFPSAPVEYTIGKAQPERCAGSGQPAVEGTRKRVGRNDYGTCSECGSTEIVTSYYVIRAHKPLKTSK